MGIELTDSAVKSCIQKALGFAQGKSPTLPYKSGKDIILKALVQSLSELAESLTGTSTRERPVTNKDWVFSLKAVENSLKTRRQMSGHSRGYLDFLKEFLVEGKEI